MRVERVSSAIRLELRPGEWVLWQARPFRFVSLHGSAARIRDTVTAELRDVAGGRAAWYADPSF
jgi:hypothetical protein